MRATFEEAKKLCGGGAATGVEVGVAYGENAKEVFEQWPDVSLILIDNYSEEPDRRAGMLKLLKGRRAQFLLESSVVAAEKLSPRQFDFVYLDGDHTYEGVKADLAAWYPLVRSGGVFGGHDYDNTLVPGVKQAVDEFAAEKGLVLHTAPGAGTQDWYVFKA